jgi:hypothetical protein
MKSITIKIHSFIDTITNSSTSIYVEATQNTIDTIKDLVTTLLKIGGSNKNADDLFDFELIDKYLQNSINSYLYDKYVEILNDIVPNYDNLSYEERSNLKSDIHTQFKSGKRNADWYTDPTNQPDFQHESWHDYNDVRVKVTPKSPDDDTNTVSDILSKLSSLFNIEACYDG